MRWGKSSAYIQIIVTDLGLVSVRNNIHVELPKDNCTYIYNNAHNTSPHIN